MSFDKLIAKVHQAEDALEAHERLASADFRQLKASWRAAWTPTRVLVAGALAGFLVGRARPLAAAGALGGARWIQLASSLAALVGSLQAKSAAGEAETAAETAEDAADHVGGSRDARKPLPDGAIAAGAGTNTATTSGATQLPPSERRRRPDQAWTAAPRPAEAATDVSER